MSKTIQTVSAIAVALMIGAGMVPANAQNEPLPEPLDDFVLNGGFELTREATPFADEICEAYGDDIWFPPEPLPALVILSCTLDENKATHWSSLEGTSFGDFDNDGDFEARLGPGHSHNLWQAYPSPHQAFSARMDSYSFTVEFSNLEGTNDNGDVFQVPNNAAVRLSLSSSPAETASPFLGIFIDCTLFWRGSDINANIDESGLVTLDPLQANFVSNYEDCDDAKALWDGEETTDDEKLDQLGRLRIIQNSFWNFNSGGNTVIVDDIGTVGSTLSALEIAADNHNL